LDGFAINSNYFAGTPFIGSRYPLSKAFFELLGVDQTEKPGKCIMAWSRFQPKPICEQATTKADVIRYFYLGITTRKQTTQRHKYQLLCGIRRHSGFSWVIDY
jgi:hypothetical protein